jgi:uncharacterized membrane protein HdeD (DUF308 family)
MMNRAGGNDEGIGAPATINRGMMLAVGLFLILLGLMGVTLSYSFTLVALFWFGLMALAAGLGQLLEAFHDEGWKSRASHAMIGLLYLAAAGALLLLPVSSAYWLTLILAVSLIGSGLARLFWLIVLRGRLGPILVNLIGALISIGLGIYIIQMIAPPSPEAVASAAGQREWASSWAWVLGLFIAVEFIVQGLSLVAAAVMAKSPQAALAAET